MVEIDIMDRRNRGKVVVVTEGVHFVRGSTGGCI